MRVRERAYGVACASAVFQPFRRKDFSSSFFPLPLSFLFSFLLFLTQPSFREARSARSQLHRAHLGSSSLRLPYPITCPPCKLIYLTRIADTIDARLPYYSAPRGSFAPFHERYRVVVKSTRPVLITTHRSIPQLRSFFLSIPLRSTIFFQPSRRVFLFHFSRLFRSSRPDRTLNLERGSIGANYSSPTPLDSALMSHHHHHHRRRRSNLLPGKYPLNLARAVRWQLR